MASIERTAYKAANTRRVGRGATSAGLGGAASRWVLLGMDEPDEPQLCDWCGSVISDATEQLYNLVPDSSFVHVSDPRFDGQRLLTACGDEHMRLLVEEYRQRPFIEAEQWACKIHRAVESNPGCRIDDENLVELTGLTVEQIYQGRELHNRRAREFLQGKRRDRF
jgi:hypothetical protein